MCLTSIPRRTRRRQMDQHIPSGKSGNRDTETQRNTSDVSSAAPPLRAKPRGFEFVELQMLITIFVILITMAIPIYNKSIIRSKEAVLRNNLFSLRTVIDNYTYDKQKAPQSLQELR